MIQVTFIFEDAYSCETRQPVEELKRWLPAVPRKGDEVDFTDYLFVMDYDLCKKDGRFLVEDVIFFMHTDGDFERIVISLIPLRNE